MGRYTLITGGAGFIGCNLAHALLQDGEEVVVADNFSREGVRRNARWLCDRHGEGLRVERADVRNADAVAALVDGAHTVFHLAAQVAVTTSLEDPRHDFDTNLLGTFNVLEAARRRDDPPTVVFTSTNKVYGGLDDLEVERTEGGYRFAGGVDGVSEAYPLDFHSPYGCSKGGADQYVRDYARIFDVPTVVFRMSCIYGEHQHGTEDQGWVAHFARAVLGGRPITLFGDGYQVRDVLWVDDLVRAFRRAGGDPGRFGGRVFNIGGGPENAVAIRDVVERLMEVTGRTVPVRSAEWRPGDQRVFVTDLSNVESALDWTPRIDVEEGLHRIVRWLAASGLEEPRPAGPRRTPAQLPTARVAAAGGAD